MSLSNAIHELTARQMDLDEFTGRFLAARIYTLCPVRPGLFVMTRAGGAAFVPVWSTIRGLRQVMGRYDWSERTGEDLAAVLPAGVAVLLDAGFARPILLPPSALTAAQTP
jgi:hypothetical protein